jgi:hypothetical protein
MMSSDTSTLPHRMPPFAHDEVAGPVEIGVAVDDRALAGADPLRVEAHRVTGPTIFAEV